MPYFTHDDMRFHYQRSGEGAEFVFSHGLGANLERVAEFVEELPGMRVTVYDNRGHGRTAPVPDAEHLNFTVMAGDVAALLDHLGVQSAIVGGVSMGSGIAVRFALDYPERVRALILSRPAWLDRPNPENLAFAPLLAPALETGDRARALEILSASRYYETLVEQDPVAAALLPEIVQLNEPGTLAACYRGIVGSAPVSSLKEMRQLRMPTLVLGCDEDAFHPMEIARLWAETIQGARLVEICPRSVDAVRHVSDFRRAATEFLETVLGPGHFRGSGRA